MEYCRCWYSHRSRNVRGTCWGLRIQFLYDSEKHIRDILNAWPAGNIQYKFQTLLYAHTMCKVTDWWNLQIVCFFQNAGARFLPRSWCITGLGTASALFMIWMFWVQNPKCSTPAFCSRFYLFYTAVKSPGGRGCTARRSCTSVHSHSILAVPPIIRPFFAHHWIPSTGWVCNYK